MNPFGIDISSDDNGDFSITATKSSPPPVRPGIPPLFLLLGAGLLIYLIA